MENGCQRTANNAGTPRIWRCLSDFRIPTDILVYSADEVAQWQDSSHHVIAKALREGRVLYEAD
jgi:hypothetical protein